MGIAAIMAGHNVVSCEMQGEQFSWGKKRMVADLKQRIDARAQLQFQMPLKYMDVHPDDVDRPVCDMRFLPNPVKLFGNDDGVVDGVDMSTFRRRVAALKVLCFFMIVFYC